MSGEKLEELLKLGPFGGIDLTTDPDKVSGSLAVDASNVVPYRTYGQYKAAMGRLSGQATGFSALETIYPTVSSVGLAFVAYTQAGSLQSAVVNTAAGNVTLPSGATLTAGLKMRYENYDGYVFCTDGADRPLKLSSSNLSIATYWGMVPPLGAPTVAVGTGTGLTGTYYWCYTYYNSTTLQESSHSPISSPLTLTNQAGGVTVAASTDSQVTSINIYRLGGTLSTWSLIATVPNAGAIYNDTLADSSVVGATLVLHRDPPANFVATCQHKDRMWGFGYNQSYPYSFNSSNAYGTIPAQPADLWFSRYAEPWSFDCVNNVIPIGRNSYGDVGVGLASNGSVLFAFKRFSTWLVFGDSEQDFRPIPALTIGAYSHECIGAGSGIVFWLSPDGDIWSWDGQNPPTNISEGDPEHGGIAGALNAANGNFAGWTFAIYRRVLYVSTGVNGPTYGFYMKTSTWHKHSYGSQWLAAIPQYPYMCGISPTGVSIDQWFGHENDDYSSPYSQYWVSGVSDGRRAWSRKSVRFVMVKIPPGDPLNTLKVTLIIDGSASQLPPTLSPRALTVDNQGVGGWYYRISVPGGNIGYSISVRLDTTQAGTTPMAISEVSIIGSYVDDFQPLNPNLAGGST